MFEVNQEIDFMAHSVILKCGFGITLIYLKLVRVLNPIWIDSQRPQFRTNPPISPKKEPKQTTCAPTNLIFDQLSRFLFYDCFLDAVNNVANIIV